jgi:uncharacterized membrane protein YgdD (TMEM256/DUF423 family)
MEKRWLFWAGFHGFFSVAMGAFAAHFLKQKLDPEALGWIETGARYQMYHAIVFLIFAGLPDKTLKKSINFSANWFLSGALIFSSALYLMAFTGHRELGILTPIGGTLLLVAWLNLIISSLRSL